MPESPRPAPLPSAFCAVVAERRLLKNLAHRLLGSAEAAEHAVRMTYGRWYTMSDEEQRGVEQPIVWLVRALVRTCVELLEPVPERSDRRTGAAVDRPGLLTYAGRRLRPWHGWRGGPKRQCSGTLG